MDRKELYELIWSKPVTQVARDLGISDVGLAKICKRLKIPRPPRGYWARKKAGRAQQQAVLPRPEWNETIVLSTGDPKERAEALAHEVNDEMDLRRRAMEAQPDLVPIVSDLEKAHSLVRETLKYVKRIPSIVRKHERLPYELRWRDGSERPPAQDHGRWLLQVPNGLNLTSSDAAMDWCLRFLDSIFKGLESRGCRVSRMEADKRDQGAGARIVVERGGEHLRFEFREGYKRVHFDADELAAKRKENKWAREWEYVASGKFTLGVRGSEYQVSKEWVGNHEQLERRLSEIVGACLDFLERQPLIRKARESEELRRHRRQEREHRISRIREARGEQLERALEAAAAAERVEVLERYLAKLETRISSFREPYDERARVWIQVVRKQLKVADPAHMILSKCLTDAGWQGWPPDWWPGQVWKR